VLAGFWRQETGRPGCSRAVGHARSQCNMESFREHWEAGLQGVGK